MLYSTNLWCDHDAWELTEMEERYVIEDITVQTSELSQLYTTRKLYGDQLFT